jgi:hypothetical protein
MQVSLADPHRTPLALALAPAHPVAYGSRMTSASDYPFTVTRQQKVLEQLKVANRQPLPQFVADNARFTLDVDHIAGRMTAQMSSYVLAEKLVSETQECAFSFPASWWQHFKIDCRLWRWVTTARLRHRWPVRMTRTTKSITFQRYRTYPDASLPLPEEQFGLPVMYEQVGPWYP